MAQSSEADRYLMAQIRRGDADGWAQLVARYQGRLLAFARSHLSRKSEGEDLVQETFIMFLQSLRTFKDECSIETYLFTILRRKIIDLYRGKKLPACFLNDVLAGRDLDSSNAEIDVRSAEPTGSWYVRRDEQAEYAKALLAGALDEFVGRLKEQENFRDLKIIELLFFGQLRNQAAADIAGIEEKQIGLIKHRMIKSVREKLERREQSADQAPIAEPTDSLLTEVWEEWRFTCPKRSTIGRFLLGTLEPAWAEYIDFHVNKLGCRFCRANVEDLRKATEIEQSKVQQRIFESTIGFFKPNAR
ncbi:MAG TPA: sigma-70 family RNA polymerase sigma factor [Tepidisphaeraceae bacterium]|nr:sigma-70 family RNA polymerase sigma factor [Tepidisphaeraceae bacterium]